MIEKLLYSGIYIYQVEATGKIRHRDKAGGSKESRQRSALSKEIIISQARAPGQGITRPCHSYIATEVRDCLIARLDPENDPENSLAQRLQSLDLE